KSLFFKQKAQSHRAEHFLFKVPKKIKLAKYPAKKNQEHLINGKDYQYSERPINVPTHFFIYFEKFCERHSKFSSGTSSYCKNQKNYKKLAIGFDIPA